MAARVARRPLAALPLLLLVPVARAERGGVDDATLLVQLQEGASLAVAHSEAAAEMLNGMLSLMRGAIGGGSSAGKQGRWLSGGKDKEHSSMASGPAGCVWSRDLKASWQYMSKLMPTVEQGVLSLMLPKMIEKAKEEPGEVTAAPDEQDKAAMMAQMQEVFAPLKDELMPPECDNALIKKKVMAQSIAGGADAEEITVRCLVKATHVTPACARCSGNFLKGFMGRGMLGLATSCVPKCMPANDACKKGLTDACITKTFPCMKCMKPGLLELADCVGINTTRFQISNKIDLFVKALREGSTSGEGLDQFVGDLVLALNA